VNGYLAIVVLAAIEGGVRVYQIRSDRRAANNRSRAAIARKAAK
jgi:hypothetical protein